jgi:hypothetical protein
MCQFSDYKIGIFWGIRSSWMWRWVAGSHHKEYSITLLRKPHNSLKFPEFALFLIWPQTDLIYIAIVVTDTNCATFWSVLLYRSHWIARIDADKSGVVIFACAYFNLRLFWPNLFGLHLEAARVQITSLRSRIQIEYFLPFPQQMLTNAQTDLAPLTKPRPHSAQHFNTLRTGDGDFRF